MSQPESMATTETHPAPGERLRLAREARELSCGDVAERLHLSVAKIEALEQGEVADTVAPVFLAGYLRAYARLVDLDAEEIIDEFASLAEWTPSSLDAVTVQPAKAYGKFSSELPVGFSLAGGRRWRTVLRWAVVGLVVIAIGGAWWQLRPGKQETASETGATSALGIPSVTQSPVMETIGDQPATSSEARTPPHEPLAPRSQLILTLVEDSWVEIIDAQGNRLMHDLGRAGETFTLTGVAPFDIMLGYAPGVKLQYNGAPYDLSRFQGRRTARFSVGASGDRMNMD